MRRSLVLRRETLTELTAADLHVVVGAAIPTQPNAGACLEALSNKVDYTHCLCRTEA
jgi:hypothetical protein